MKYKVIKQDAIFEGMKKIVYETDNKDEAQLYADRYTNTDKYGNYYYYVEPNET